MHPKKLVLRRHPSYGESRELGLLSLVLLGWAAGCAGSQQLPTTPPSEPTTEMVQVHSADVGAIVYDQRQPAELGGLLGQLLSLIERTALSSGKPLPAVDEAVQAAVTEIGRGLRPGQPPPSELVEYAMRRQGLIDPPPHFIIASLPEGGEQSLGEQLAKRLPRVMAQGTYRRVGLALVNPRQAPAKRLLVVGFFASSIQLDPPLPRLLERGQTARLALRLSSGHRDLALVVTDPQGQTTSRSLARVGARFVGQISCNSPGVLQVEVTGADQIGTEVLANFPCYCGVSPPQEVRYAVAAQVSLSAAEIERLIHQRTNVERRRAGLLPLRENAALGRVARQHSQQMLEAGFVGHTSPVTGSTPADRIRRAGIVHLVARENVARAYSPDEVVRELMRSPAHRSNILAADVSELGVGVVVDRQEQVPVLLVTQNFIKPGTPYDAQRAPEDLFHLVQRTRRAAGLPALALDEQLSGLARRYLQAIARGGSQQQADQELSGELRRIAHRYQQVEGVFLRLGVLDGVTQTKEILRRRATHLGVGSQRAGDQLAVFLLLGVAR